MITIMGLINTMKSLVVKTCCGFVPIHKIVFFDPSPESLRLRNCL